MNEKALAKTLTGILSDLIAIPSPFPPGESVEICRYAAARLRKVNPLAQVPTLEMPDGSVMSESAAITLLLGVDRFMSQMRSLVNLSGNAVATLVVAKWEGEFDSSKAMQVVSGKVEPKVGYAVSGSE